MRVLLRHSSHFAAFNRPLIILWDRFKRIYMRKDFIFFAHSSLDNNGTGGNTFIGRGTGMKYRWLGEIRGKGRHRRARVYTMTPKNKHICEQVLGIVTWLHLTQVSPHWCRASQVFNLHKNLFSFGWSLYWQAKFSLSFRIFLLSFEFILTSTSWPHNFFQSIIS